MVDAPRIGVLASGTRDSIADVAGVTVGHATLADAYIQTGVTVVRPHPGDLYREPFPAASVVLNGFGKTVGLVQLHELGMLESPIALTNTFAVGKIATAMIRHAVASNPSIGRTLPTLNPVVAECNDGFLNDLQAFAITEAHYARALDAATSAFAQGAVGAGRGMSCFQLKGGIGSGIARTGSNFPHASGDIAIAFSTGGRPGRDGHGRTPSGTLRDDALDPLFDAAADATEQSIVNALFAAETVAGRDGHVREAITARLPDWRRHFPAR